VSTARAQLLRQGSCGTQAAYDHSPERFSPLSYRLSSGPAGRPLCTTSPKVSIHGEIEKGRGERQDEFNQWGHEWMQVRYHKVMKRQRSGGNIKRRERSDRKYTQRKVRGKKVIRTYDRSESKRGRTHSDRVVMMGKWRREMRSRD